MNLIIHYVKPYARRMGFGVTIKFLGAVTELFIPYILAHIIDNVTPHGDMSRVIRWGGIMLLCSLGAWVMNILANRTAAAVARDSVRTLRHDLFEKIMHLSNRQVDSFTIPSLISRMTTDTYNIHRVIGVMQRMGIRAPILLLGGIAVTMTLDTAMACVLLALVPVMILLVYGISKKSLPMFTNIQLAMDGLVRIVRENASGIRVIKALSKTEYEKQRFSRVSGEVVKAETKANTTMGLSRPVMNMVFNFGLVLVIIVGAYRVNAGQAEVGTIVAFLSYFTIMLNAILGVNRILIMLQNSLASAERIHEVMSSESELRIENAGGSDGDFHIEMKDVSFSYDGKEDNICGISFGVKRGESLGIIGPTGSGKSTVAALLLRFYDVQRGAIYIDGKNIRSMELCQLRQRFGVVFQNDTVFNNTMGENIRLGREISMKAVDKAIESAQAQQYIQAAGGMSHMVDARGANLSGGQRQRLLIARALAGQPDILILDDSSSALDYKTDAQMRGELKRSYSGTTSILIAQRVSSIKHCDKILVLEDGHVSGYGSHEMLMNNCRLYQEIYAIQMGE